MGKKEELLNNTNIATILGKGTIFKGTLSYEGTIRIDGKFDGDINTTGTLVVGESAHIKASIKASNLSLSGKIEGNVDVSNKCEILSGGILLGDITVKKLVIEEGVIFNGSCNMKGNNQPVQQNTEKKGFFSKNKNSYE